MILAKNKQLYSDIVQNINIFIWETLFDTADCLFTDQMKAQKL